MSLAELPSELILSVGDFLESEKDINAFAQTSRVLYCVLNPYLYRRNASHGCSSALWWAVLRARVGTVRRALDYGADWNHLTNQVDEDGQARIPVFKYAVEHAKPVREHRMRGTDAEISETFRLLVESGADIDAGALPGGITAARLAFEVHDLPALRALAENGANIRVADRLGQTGFHVAAASGAPDSILEFAIRDGGFHVDVRDLDGETPLAMASQHLEVKAMHFLLQNGADPNVLDDDGFTPLHRTVGREALEGSSRDMFPWADATEECRLLLDNGANALTPCLHGTNVLHLAAMTDATHDLVCLLLQHGVDVNARNRNGRTPLHYVNPAVPGLVPLLLSHGADVNAQTSRGNTPLHSKLRSGPVNLELVQVLLDAGTDIFAKNCHGQSVYNLLKLLGLLSAVSLTV